MGCALWWAVDASNPLGAIDAWLWLVCFAVVALNVLGFEKGQACREDTPPLKPNA